MSRLNDEHPLSEAEVEHFASEARRRAAAESPFSPAAERALVERVLAATTRVQPLWREQLATIRAFCRERWQDSRLLRVAAASLVAHLVALPAVAWYVFREPKPPVAIGFVPPIETPFVEEEPRSELRELDIPDALSLLDAGGTSRSASEIENARRRARFRLHTVTLPDGAPEPTSVAGRVLVARARGISAADWSDLPSAALVDGDPLARALRADALLDRAVLTGDRSGLREALAALSVDGDPSTNGAPEPLEAETARRALALGMADEDLEAGWHADRWFGADAEIWADPISTRWCALLARGESEDPVVAAWSEVAR